MFPRILNPLMLVTITSTVPFLLLAARPAAERGRVTGPDACTVDWQGEVELNQRTASR